MSTLKDLQKVSKDYKDAQYKLGIEFSCKFMKSITGNWKLDFEPNNHIVIISESLQKELELFNIIPPKNIKLVVNSNLIQSVNYKVEFPINMIIVHKDDPYCIIPELSYFIDTGDIYIAKPSIQVQKRSPV